MELNPHDHLFLIRDAIGRFPPSHFFIEQVQLYF